MKTRDFALAPSGATHIYPDTAMKPSIPIPPREIELNQLADSNIVVDGECDTYGEFDITGGDINERRRHRLEAGLVSEDKGNSSEILEGSEDHLTWLARNIDQAFVIKRRRELGLEPAQPDDGVAEALDEMARLNQETGQYDMTGNPLIKDYPSACSQCGALVSEQVVKLEQPSDEWVDGLPPVGAECWLTIGGQNHHIDVEGYSRNKDVVFVKYTGLFEFDYWFLNDDAEFRPIETEQQKAERERDEGIFAILETMGYPNPLVMLRDKTPRYKEAARLYDKGYRLVKED